MSMPSLTPPADNSKTFDGQVRAYRRAYQRLLRQRPTDLQRALMENAAYMAARLDAAVRNPEIGAQNLAHIERVYRKSKAAMLASFPAKHAAAPTFADAMVARP